MPRRTLTSPAALLSFRVTPASAIIGSASSVGSGEVMGSDSYASSARRASRRYGPAAGTIKATFTALWPVLALLAALAHGAPARANPITVLAFGVSLTTCYGLSDPNSGGEGKRVADRGI